VYGEVDVGLEVWSSHPLQIDSSRDLGRVRQGLSTGLDRFSPAIKGIDIVFKGGNPPTPLPTTQKPSSTGSFTVMEYRLYRAVIDTPMSISESEAIPRIARDYNVTPQQVRDAWQERSGFSLMTGIRDAGDSKWGPDVIPGPC